MDHFDWTQLPTNIIGLLALIALVWGSIIMRSIHRQVVNDHKDQPNLREDIDFIRQSVKHLLKTSDQVTEDFIELRRSVEQVRFQTASTDAAILDELREERERSVRADSVLNQRLDRVIGEP